MTHLLPTSRRTALVAAVAAAGAFAIVAGAPRSAWADAQPGVTLDRPEAAPGDTLVVDFAGWTPGNVYLEICGNEALRGSIDCDVGSALTSYATQEGSGHALLKVQVPPIGCPCVVRVSDLAQAVVIATPFTVTGVPVLTDQERPSATVMERKLTVVRAELTGRSGVTALLGATARRTLVLTVRNSGGGPVTDPSVSLAVGRGSSATTIVDPPPLGRLEPGQEKTFEIPISLEVPSFGRYTVEGEIAGLNEPVTFTATTSAYPWGLPVFAALVIGLAVASKRATRTLRRRGAAAGVIEVGIVGETRRGVAPERVIDLTGPTPTDREVIDLTDTVSSDD